MASKAKTNRGRPVKLTDSARKRNRKEVLAKYNKTKINIGKEHDRWISLKDRLNLGSHAEVAKILIDWLIALAFSAAVGITFLVLGCALFQNWWPMFVLFFYFLSPVPTIISRRLATSLDTASSACVEFCIFLTVGIVISSIGLPVILAHTLVIEWGACGLVLAGNLVVFLTILGYFFVFGNDDMDYSSW